VVDRVLFGRDWVNGKPLVKYVQRFKDSVLFVKPVYLIEELGLIVFIFDIWGWTSDGW
jgi:hypothetical protein